MDSMSPSTRLLSKPILQIKQRNNIWYYFGIYPAIDFNGGGTNG
jgi:hypothetical protein